jgi:hypothetical protein
VLLAVGTIDPAVIPPTILTLAPAYKSLAIPIPPLTIKEPVPIDVESVVPLASILKQVEIYLLMAQLIQRQ